MVRYFTSVDNCDILFKVDADDMNVTNVPNASFYIEHIYFIDEDGTFEYVNRYKEKITLTVYAGDIVLKVGPLRYYTIKEDKKEDKSKYPYNEFFVIQDPILKQNILSKRKLNNEIDKILKK